MTGVPVGDEASIVIKGGTDGEMTVAHDGSAPIAERGGSVEDGRSNG